MLQACKPAGAWFVAMMLALPGMAVACSLDAWDETVTAGAPADQLRVGTPEDASPVPRYSGRCAAITKAPGNYVVDVHDRAEWSYHARFYVFVDVPAEEVEFFRATNEAGQSVLTIRQNLTTLKFNNSAGVTTTTPVVPGRWYAIELDWYAGQPMTVEVRGAGGEPTPRFATAASAGTDRIKRVWLGWVSGAGTGRIAFDAYASRRLTGWESDIKIGRLCRGDSDPYYAEYSPYNAGLDAGDMVRARNEAGGLGLAPGQPDCDENGVITGADATCIGTAIVGRKQCD